MLSARPFRRFTLVLDDARTRVVDAPDRVAVAPSGSVIFLASEEVAEPVPVGRVVSIRLDDGPRVPLASVRFVVFDFDGVWTDNRVMVMQDGTEGVLCDRSDGLGLEMLRESGMGMLVLSKERNPVVAARCAKLKIECVQGIDDKLSALTSICLDRGIPLEATAYVGNDVNDVACMRAVGVPVAVADAYPQAIAAAVLVTNRPGGRGAVREVCQWILQAKGPAR